MEWKITRVLPNNELFTDYVIQERYVTDYKRKKEIKQAIKIGWVIKDTIKGKNNRITNIILEFPGFDGDFLIFSRKAK